MTTKILNVKYTKAAAKILKEGGLVAFPTETVYGLAADASNKNAVARIYEIKNRPSTKPLTLHISKLSVVGKIAQTNFASKKLMEAFWPGPLTIIFNKKLDPPCFLAPFTKTVAIRFPANLVAREIIEKSGLFIVATSVNASGQKSSTTFEEVLKELEGKIEAIVYSVKQELNIESTIVDATDENGVILIRTGAISKEKIEKVVSVR